MVTRVGGKRCMSQRAVHLRSPSLFASGGCFARCHGALRGKRLICVMARDARGERSSYFGNAASEPAATHAKQPTSGLASAHENSESTHKRCSMALAPVHSRRTHTVSSRIHTAKPIRHHRKKGYSSWKTYLSAHRVSAPDRPNTH